MPDKLPTSPVRGTRDLLPAECALRDEALAAILRTYRSWGFARIETPALEHLELLTGGQGGENEKLIFKLMKRGEKLDLAKPGLTEDDVADCGLRFDLTVPLARYYAEHASELPLPFKAIQVGPVWRAERPQKGRYRQFTQCDIDVIGDASPSAEVELILATCDALSAVGLSGFTVRMNDRRVFDDIATYCGIPANKRSEFLIAWDKLDKIGPEGVLGELAPMLGDASRSQVDRIIRMSDGSAVLLEVKQSASEAAYAAALRQLAKYVGKSAAQSARVSIDTNLVRGMGYYTGSIFEIAVDGLPYSIAGGGRYDKMIGRITGHDVPACGFSIGFERLILLLQERSWRPAATTRRIALVYDADAGQLDAALQRAQQLRAEGAVVSLFAQKKKAGKQRADLEAQGFEIESLAPRGGGAE